MIHFNLIVIDVRVLQCSRRSSLTPPPQSIVTWDEYINAEAGKHPTLGRQQNCKESLKTFRANLAMV